MRTATWRGLTFYPGHMRVLELAAEAGDCHAVVVCSQWQVVDPPPPPPDPVRVARQARCAAAAQVVADAAALSVLRRTLD